MPLSSELSSPLSVPDPVLERVSVVLAVYNGEPYLAEQLDSIASQTRPFDELLIRDDGSTDHSNAVINAWIEAHPNLNVRVLDSDENLGYIRNFARLLEEASGDFIFLCDQDDRWHSDKIETMLQAHREFPEAQVIASSFSFINQNGELFEIDPIPGWSNQNLLQKADVTLNGMTPIELSDIFIHNGFQGCAMMITKDIARRYVADQNFLLPHDWQLALLGATTHSLYYLDKRLFDYRIHDSNTTSLPQAYSDSLLTKLKHARTYYYRTAPYLDRIHVLCSLQITQSDLFTKDMAEELAFLETYMEAMDRRSFSLYRKLMKNPKRSCMTRKEQICGWIYVLAGYRDKNRKR